VYILDLNCPFLIGHYLSLPSFSHKIISRGPVELVEYFLDEKRAFAVNFVNNDPSNDAKLKSIMEAHLTYLYPYIDFWPKALALIASNADYGRSANMAIDMSDDFCKVADIKTSRLNWYSERSALLAIYMSAG